ncbi:hypothetical protein [Pararhizobium sp.]|uniref:hypothetical protein n=1 Tax=Pararhizobium sp. TaxID=1977563 RepID=UPI003D0EF65F
MDAAVSHVKPSYSEGYALCMPCGRLLGKTFRDKPADAIAAMFDDPATREEWWHVAQAHGWTLRYVFSQVWIPKFFRSEPETETA